MTFFFTSKNVRSCILLIKSSMVTVITLQNVWSCRKVYISLFKALIEKTESYSPIQFIPTEKTAVKMTSESSTFFGV